MVSCKFFPWWPLLSWQPTIFIQRRNWLQADKRVKRWNAAARLCSVAMGQIPHSTERISSYISFHGFYSQGKSGILRSPGRYGIFRGSGKVREFKRYWCSKVNTGAEKYLQLLRTTVKIFPAWFARWLFVPSLDNASEDSQHTGAIQISLLLLLLNLFHRPCL